MREEGQKQIKLNFSETTYSKGCKRNRNHIIIFIVNGRLEEENMD
jgi:hypothetical protein